MYNNITELNLKKYKLRIENLLDDRILLAEKPYSTHPEDSYLSIRLFLLYPNTDNKKLVVWIYNKKYGDHFSGFYTNSIIEAVDNYNSRGVHQ